MNESRSLFDIPVRTIDGTNTTLESYRGKVLLIVNVASKCGYTPQYKGLEDLYERYGERGLVVLGFPCNQFGGQEPGTEDEIQSFCETSFGVRFPMFSKVDVNGENAHPLFERLKHEAKGLIGTEFIKWNFTKFLVDRSGVVVRRFGPMETPASIESELLALL